VKAKQRFQLYSYKFTTSMLLLHTQVIRQNRGYFDPISYATFSVVDGVNSI